MKKGEVKIGDRLRVADDRLTKGEYNGCTVSVLEIDRLGFVRCELLSGDQAGFRLWFNANELEEAR